MCSSGSLDGILGRSIYFIDGSRESSPSRLSFIRSDIRTLLWRVSSIVPIGSYMIYLLLAGGGTASLAECMKEQFWYCGVVVSFTLLYFSPLPLKTLLKQHTNDSLGHHKHEPSFTFFHVPYSQKCIRSFLGFACGFGRHDTGNYVLVS